MKAEILKRIRLSNGYYDFRGAVDGVTRIHGKALGVVMPAQYVESLSETEADAFVKEELCAQYDALTRATQGQLGGAYVR